MSNGSQDAATVTLKRAKGKIDGANEKWQEYLTYPQAEQEKAISAEMASKRETLMTTFIIPASSRRLLRWKREIWMNITSTRVNLPHFMPILIPLPRNRCSLIVRTSTVLTSPPTPALTAWRLC
ncbi:MAG: Tar ligand binding domain-containing protein [Symbiopectobacterium sp.]